MSERVSEESDAYPYVLARAGKARVIDCKHHMQWIVQAHRGRWRSIAFHRFRDTLFERLAGLPALRAQLKSLPEHHPDIDRSMKRRATATLGAGGSRKEALPGAE